jgi:hypothetical protein
MLDENLQPLYQERRFRRMAIGALAMFSFFL